MPPDEPGVELHCPNCLYCLRGLPTHRCPECGNNFDPHELRAFCRRPPLVVVLGAAFLIVVAVAVARVLAHGLCGDYLREFLPLAAIWPARFTFWAFGLVLAVGLGGALVVNAWRRLRRTRRIRGRGGVPLLAGAFLVCVLAAAVATIYLEIGPF